MSNPEILVIGTNADILKTILRLLNSKAGWCGTGAGSAAEAVDVFKTKTFDLVLFGAGIEEAEEQQLRTRLAALQPGVIFVRHYGGGSGLLYAEVLQALG